MPAALERKLKRQARKKGLKGKRARAYVYGTMRKTGWKPSRERRRRRRMAVRSRRRRTGRRGRRK